MGPSPHPGHHADDEVSPERQQFEPEPKGALFHSRCTQGGRRLTLGIMRMTRSPPSGSSLSVPSTGSYSPTAWLHGTALASVP
jgi:hypothetical protein